MTARLLQTALEAALEAKRASPDAAHVKDNPAFRAWFGRSKVVDANGDPLPVYRGDYRGDRIGPSFKLNRSTSGRFYFTDDPEIASNYSVSKPDAGHIEENGGYDKWFRFPGLKGRGERVAPHLGQIWHRLSPEEKRRVEQVARRTSWSEEDDSEFDFESGQSIYPDMDYLVRRNHGNWLMALHEAWLESGALFNEERRFSEILDAAGIDHVYDNPSDPRSTVTAVYLRIENPLDTARIPPELIERMRAFVASDRTRGPSRRDGFGQWDKAAQTPRQFFETLVEDQKNGTTYAWTTMPEKITKFLQAEGYDGVRDRGGKNGGAGHTVWIAFEPSQIKSAIGNSGKYDSSKDSITAAFRAAPVAVGKAAKLLKAAAEWELDPEDLLPVVREAKEATGESAEDIDDDALLEEIVRARKQIARLVSPGGGMRVFRQIVLRDPAWLGSLRPGDRLGTDWSWDERGAFSYDGGEGPAAVFEAEAPESSIDWPATIAMMSSGEAEVRLVRGGEVEVLGVRLAEDRRSRASKPARPDLAGAWFVA